MGGIDKAKELITRSLAKGKQVVTANKALLAEEGESLFRLADEKGATLLYEASVAGGIPIVQTLKESLTGNHITSLEGILNGTGNYILSEMTSKGVNFAPALAEAQEKGYAEADPTLRITRDEDTHQTIIHAMGEAQVDMLLSRLKEQSGVEAKLVPVRIPYRETITKQAEAQGRHKKQTGGAGQFGDCWLRLAPIPGEGYEFVDEIKGGAIPNGLIPAVDKGVREAMEEGFLAGYPMVDIKCTVFDGSYHSVDSNEMAFKTAARIGFRACCENAGPIILEPWATMEVTVGEEYAGTIMGDISTRRGRIVGTDAGFAAGETIIKMRAPYAEVINYTKDLRSMTRGSGSYTLTLEGYEQAPADVTKKLVEAYEAARAAGN
mgnify:CR=1 FL=1